jgi:hypothetical protein
MRRRGPSRCPSLRTGSRPCARAVCGAGGSTARVVQRRRRCREQPAGGRPAVWCVLRTHAFRQHVCVVRVESCRAKTRCPEVTAPLRHSRRPFDIHWTCVHRAQRGAAQTGARPRAAWRHAGARRVQGAPERSLRSACTARFLPPVPPPALPARAARASHRGSAQPRQLPRALAGSRSRKPSAQCVSAHPARTPRQQRPVRRNAGHQDRAGRRHEGRCGHPRREGAHALALQQFRVGRGHRASAWPRTRTLLPPGPAPSDARLRYCDMRSAGRSARRSAPAASCGVHDTALALRANCNLRTPPRHRA